MAELDVEGRQARMISGKRRLAMEFNRGALEFSEHGLAPRDDHRGGSPDQVPSGRKHIVQKGGSEIVQKGKRPATQDTAARSPSPQSRMMLGKFGLKKVKQPVKAEEAIVRPKLHMGVRSMTCEERARIAVSQAVHRDPTLVAPEKLNKAMEEGGSTLLELERTLKKQREVAEFHRALRDDTQRSASANRAPPSAPSRIPNSPITIDTTIPNQPFKPGKRRLDGPASEDHVHYGKQIHFSRRGRGDVPFDNSLANEKYPDPPVFGHAHNETHGKLRVDPGLVGRDLDTIVAEKAEKKSQCLHPDRAQGMPDFLFGCPPPPPVKPRASASPQPHHDFLDHERSDSNAFGVSASRTRAFAGMKYKPTALW